MTICVCNTCNTPMNFRDMYCPKCHPDGLTLFEGVTKEAHDKLKEQNALLASEVERLREGYKEIIAWIDENDDYHCDYDHIEQIARRAMEG